MPNLTQSRRFVCLLTALLVATGAQAAKVDEGGAGPQDGECHRAGKPGAARLGRLLQAQPEQASTGRAGWLGQAQTSLCHLAAMEAALYEGAQPDAPGIERGACLQVGLQWPRPVVELRSATYESGAAEEAMGQTWTGLDTGYDQSA